VVKPKVVDTGIYGPSMRCDSQTEFKLGACPGESGLAGTTPAQVKQSMEGAGMILLSAIPIAEIADVLGGAGDAAAEDSSIADAAASCGGDSFTAGTRVLLANGTAVPIASLTPGARVLATNVTTGKTQAEPVTAVMVHHDTDLYDLKVTSGGHVTVIHTTSNHLFWDPYQHQWIASNKLAKGEHLQTPDGTTAVAEGGAAPKVHDGWMWDLTVPGNNDHDFYVQAGSASVLVHNCQTFPNKYNDPEMLQGELSAAADAKVAPISAGTQGFSDAVSGGGRYLWAVGENGELRIAPEASQAIKHTILFAGADVQGAGIADFVDGAVESITDESGHYAPWEGAPPSFIQSGVNAFRAAGISVPDEAIQPWEGW
jgi:hypothetical protein